MHATTGKVKAAHIPVSLLSVKALLQIAGNLLQRLGGGPLHPTVELLANYAGGNPRAFEALLVAGCHCMWPDCAMQVPQQEPTAKTRSRVRSDLLKQVRSPTADPA